MKKILAIFFITLGVIFFLLIVAGVYFYVADPLNLKPLLQGSTQAQPTATESVDRNPALNTEQEQALEAVGIDPAAVPSEITPAQAACFVDILGQARVDEITAGATPTPVEILRARSCLE